MGYFRLTRLILNALALASILGAGLSFSEHAQPADGAAEELWWWQHNDGTPVWVELGFYFPALGVVPKESGWRANAVSAGYDSRLGVYYYHCGWFQIEMHTWQSLFYANGWSWDDCQDPGKNSEIARQIWRDYGGWVHWPNTARGYY